MFYRRFCIIYPGFDVIYNHNKKETVHPGGWYNEIIIDYFGVKNII